MSSLVEDFVQSPSEELPDQCNKEQLLKIAEHFEIEIPHTRLNDTVKTVLKNRLANIEILLTDVSKYAVCSALSTSTS